MTRCTAPIAGHIRGSVAERECPVCGTKSLTGNGNAANLAPSASIQPNYFDDHAGEGEDELNWDDTEDWVHAGSLDNQAKEYLARWPVPGPQYSDSDREIWLAHFIDNTVLNDSDSESESLRALWKAAHPNEHSPTVLCSDCTYEQENENPDPAYTNNSTCAECFENEVECQHEGHADDDFSSAACGKCETTLAGQRVHYAYWRGDDRSEEFEPRDIFA